MAGLMSKGKDLMLGPSYEDEYDEEYEDEYGDEYEEEPAPIRKSNDYKRLNDYKDSYSSGMYKRANNSKVVNISTNVRMEVVLTTPETLEEADMVCNYLKEKKTIIVNLEKIEHETAQRITDFLCGACCALDGSIQLISDEIFIIGPVNVDITGQFKEELKANGIKLPHTTMWK